MDGSVLLARVESKRCQVLKEQSSKRNCCPEAHTIPTLKLLLLLVKLVFHNLNKGLVICILILGCGTSGAVLEG